MSRFVITWHVGKRDEVAAEAFTADLRARLVVMPTLMATDGLSTYEAPLSKHFGPALPYGQVVKNYRAGAQRGPDHRYEPPREPFITKRVVSGAPDMDKASTSYVERQNGTMRHRIGRWTCSRGGRRRRRLRVSGNYRSSARMSDAIDRGSAGLIGRGWRIRGGFRPCVGPWI